MLFTVAGGGSSTALAATTPPESTKSVYVDRAAERLASWETTIAALRRKRARMAPESASYRELDATLGRLEEEWGHAKAALRDVREAKPAQWGAARERLDRRMAFLDALPLTLRRAATAP